MTRSMMASSDGLVEDVASWIELVVVAAVVDGN